MSQYPSPYYPPNVQPPPYMPYGGADGSPSARRAGVLMFILGGLLTLLGVCDVLQAFLVPIEKQMASARQMQPQGSAEMPEGVMKAFMIGVPFLILLLGLAYIALAVGVRRSGKGSTIVATILTSILLALLALLELAALIIGMQVPAALAMGCVVLLPMGLMVPLLIFLINTLRAAPQNSFAQQQYMAQYWHYQQQMQANPAYGYAQPQPGLGYAPPPPPQTSQPPAPPTDFPTQPPTG